MIKVYLDWNVMVGMKANRFPELTEILSDKEKFLIPYSSSHLGDLSSSISDEEKQGDVIKEDLDFISKLTDDFCLFNSLENILLEARSPNEMFEQQISNTSLDLEKIFESLNDDISLNFINTYKTFLKSIKLNEVLKEALNNDETIERINKLLPGFTEDKTLYGLINSLFLSYNNLNNTEHYKYLRETVQQLGINSSHFNPHKNPFKIIENIWMKQNISDNDYTKYFKNSKNLPIWFSNIINQYIILDMHGYKSDTIKVTNKKKQTFKNTTDDASHSAFASICNIYITNDDKNYHKTKTVYDKLNIKTKVFKPNEFISFYKEYLKSTNMLDHFVDFINTAKLLEQPIYDIYNDDGSCFGKGAHLDMFLFNLFNKIWIIENDNGNASLILSINYPNNSFQLIAYREIEYLIKFFSDVLGNDMYDNASLTDSDIKDITEETWVGRKWKTNIGEITISRLNGYFQLYYNHPTTESPE